MSQKQKKTIDQLLSKHDFFADLSPDYVDLIAGCGKNQVFEKDTFLTRQGEEANSFFVIRKGQANIELHGADRGPITIDSASAGDVVGWSWLFPPYEWSFDIRASEPVHAIVMDGKCLRKKCEENHELGYQFMKRFSEIFTKRLTATRLQLLDLYGTS
jgi:CRP-like cAMP-binding protein